MPVVDYNLTNLQRCRCMTCPVFQNSQCVMQKVEGIYCSQAVDKSQCTDLNGNLACVCPTCAVWQEYGLQTNYFCIKGAAT